MTFSNPFCLKFSVQIKSFIVRILLCFLKASMWRENIVQSRRGGNRLHLRILHSPFKTYFLWIMMPQSCFTPPGILKALETLFEFCKNIFVIACRSLRIPPLLKVCSIPLEESRELKTIFLQSGRKVKENFVFSLQEYENLAGDVLY